MDFSISSITERDLDLLLLEEFVSSPSFASWFSKQVSNLKLAVDPVSSARRSVTTASGESDLEVALVLFDESIHYLLIENKVSAGFQPKQAERYVIRGDSYVRNGECSSYTTVLVAPKAFFGKNENNFGFQSTIAYEMISKWYRKSQVDKQRSEFKQATIKSAIEKSLLGYQPTEDSIVTKFWQEYWILASNLVPELEMTKPESKPSGAGFIWFRPHSLPHDVAIVHKLAYGNLDLQFAGRGAELSDFRKNLEKHLEAGMKVVRANKSASVRLKVPTLDTTSSFELQSKQAREGLEAARKLLIWYSSNKDTF